MTVKSEPPLGKGSLGWDGALRTLLYRLNMEEEGRAIKPLTLRTDSLCQRTAENLL